MARFMNLSRAARLVGVTRVALQKKIKDGVLPSFEGMVSDEGLLQVYPDLQIEDNTVFEPIGRGKTVGFGVRALEQLPNKEVLASRLAVLGQELADAQTELRAYHTLAQGLEEQLKTWEGGGAEMQAAAAALKLWLHQALQTRAQRAGLPNLAIRDVFLRVMASHVQLRPSGHDFFVDGTDTLLEAALRAGLAPSYGCSNGNCGKCKTRVVSGEVLKVRPHDYVLSEAEKASGYALMCSNTAVSDVVLEADEAQAATDILPQRITAYVKGIDRLGADMLLLRLQTLPDQRLRFLAGQNVVLQLGQSLSGEFPVAGCPCDDRNLPFHIQNLPGNHVANYVATRLKVGDAVVVEGPKGDFILDKDAARPLLFIAFGKGFAPVKGLLEQAMALDAAESMHLYWAVAREDDLYFANWPRAMADALDNFRYTPLLAGTDLETAAARHDKVLDNLLAQIGDDYPAIGNCDVYVAGPELLTEVAASWLHARGLPAAQLKVSVIR